ncbi:MoxR family ATPase [Cognatiyoonia sp. IB215446]|uniref:MoxR family ATPase n=1 Tax=Cognatiyoonia sp. IB215446 TaxID=3097355 RepID=UPI002A10EB9F|nr:MoxR family ATPase [Cognatiyoonia sp. IB215446]MDX8348475.1 MoxR family ATPase [Cognatiyoonia sp. IB215446]
MVKHLSPLQDAAMTCSLNGTEMPHNPWLGLRRKDRFFESEEISALVQRALFYARAGVPIHFQGTAGRGKTAVALEIATRIGRSVRVITGNEWLDVEDLIGKQVGHTSNSVVDKYVQRVRRSEATIRYDWKNSILAEAMLQGHTLIYDEFTRASAQANGILLSVLEEGVLIATDPVSMGDHIQAHRDFRIILTSNPDDYSGVNKMPDALLDRMITFQMPLYSLETESGVVATRTGISANLSTRIVRLVNELTGPERVCSMRASIMIAQIAALRLRSSKLSDALLAQIATDVLMGRGIAVSAAQVAQSLSQMHKQETVT